MISWRVRASQGLEGGIELGVVVIGHVVSRAGLGEPPYRPVALPSIYCLLGESS